MSVTREGPTPLGGVRSEAVMFDADGSEVEDLDLAVRGEITEYAAEGDELGRTYFELRPGQDPDVFPLNIPADADNGNEPDAGNDGPKQTWDIWHVVDGVWERPVETKDELLRALGYGGAPLVEQMRFVANMLSLPVWSAAPANLRDEVYSWLESNRQE